MGYEPEMAVIWLSNRWTRKKTDMLRDSAETQQVPTTQRVGGRAYKETFVVAHHSMTSGEQYLVRYSVVVQCIELVLAWLFKLPETSDYRFRVLSTLIPILVLLVLLLLLS
jgi:hypothetical protein